MNRKQLASLCLLLLLALYGCGDKTANKTGGNSETGQKQHAGKGSGSYTRSLREACERFNKALTDNDSATRQSLLDAEYAITARGRSFASHAEYRAFMAAQKSTPRQDEQIRSSYHIDEVEAGSDEPVWAGYERGTFEQHATTTDGQSRKVSGPYFRAWKLVDGQWKCYHQTVMAFKCEGYDCEE